MRKTVLLTAGAILAAIALPGAVMANEGQGQGLAKNVDTDGDGVLDAWDYNNDGAADAFDDDGDGEPDRLLIEASQDSAT